MTRLRQFSQAVGEMEGYYVTQAQAAARHIPFPTLPQKLNNPGDLIFVGQRKAVPFSVVGGDGKVRIYCKFETIEDGFEACDFQLELYAKRGSTVQGTINKWAPADDGNNPTSYTAGVCKLMGCKPTDLLSEVIKDASPVTTT